MKNIFTSLFVFLSFGLFAQKAKFNNILYYEYVRPATYQNIQSYDIDISGNENHNLSDSEINTWISLPISEKEENADMTLLLDFEKKIVTGKKVDKHQNKNKEGKVIETYYTASLTMKQPVYLKLIDHSGNVLKTVKAYTGETTGTAGNYNSSKQASNEGMKAAYSNTSAKLDENRDESIKRIVRKYAYQLVDVTVNKSTHTKYNETYQPIIIFKGKKVDTDGFEAAADTVIEAFGTSNEVTEADIQSAIDFWKNQLETIDPENKKVKKAYFASATNLAHVYFVLGDYQKAREYLEIAKGHKFARNVNNRIASKIDNQESASLVE